MKPARTLKSRPTSHVDTSTPDIAEWSEDAEQEDSHSSDVLKGDKFTIPGLGKVSRTELAGRAPRHISVKPIIIGLCVLATLLVFVCGSVFLVPQVSRIARDRDCAVLTQAAQKDARQWAMQTRLAQQLLSANSGEYSDPKVVEQVKKSMRNAPTDLAACAVNQQEFQQQASMLHGKLAALTRANRVAQASHGKAVQKARTGALSQADFTRKYAKTISKAHAAAARNLNNLVDTAVGKQYSTVAQWNNARTMLVKAQAETQQRISQQEAEKTRKQAAKKKQAPAPAVGEQQIPRRQQSQSAPKPYSTPRAYTPAPAAPRSPISPAPQTWSVPSQGCTEGCL